ncbi:Uncharacterised protein [Mycobacterium tuberculosis]|uniref:Uncharacterized protein n=1 Tax=Mycobacterium tuberculosis TaxID=1773 RepID=A0A655AVG3_MYCTX|nr:Uncharacterised protein [Mycobacterium tuberculosis]
MRSILTISYFNCWGFPIFSFWSLFTITPLKTLFTFVPFFTFSTICNYNFF